LGIIHIAEEMANIVIEKTGFKYAKGMAKA